ncbi:MAG TPA: YggS family pyridoxal phosphate-dependent enzyme, partial [Candidatus Polarisedimenticolia bacterium]|nr:YggS family pyridoxal phosphate-dependent enzyme [Candidatus Polarisedimenticolia bacterium]
LYLMRMVSPIASNLKALHGRIEAAARHAGRDPGSIVLVGVSKTVDKERIVEAIEAGLQDLGENRVQEAREKIPLLPATARWHLVGHLQGNKVNQAARLFQVVHSIDSADLLRRLDQAAAKEGRRIEALVQVDLAGEATKFGVGEERLDEVLEAGAACGSVAVRGLMILPPQDADPEKARPYFRRLRRLLEEAGARHRALPLDQLSMGMSEDFEVGIEEGATMVRVGRALFGERRTRTGGGE